MHRVLVVTSTFPRWAGDTEPRFVLDLCRHLKSTMDVLVIAPHAPGAAIDEVLEGVRVRRFRYFVPSWQGLTYAGGIMSRLRQRKWRAIQLPFLLTAIYRAIGRAVREWKPDVIHAHWIIPQGVLACLAASRRTPVVCTSHGSDLFRLNEFPFSSLKSWTLKHCRAVTVVSGGMVETARRLAADVPVHVIPMGTELGELFTPPPDSGARGRTGLLFVGRLVEKKGLRHLLDALAALRAQDTITTLTVVGDGPLKESLKRRARDLDLGESVTFAGSVGHADLPAFYRRAAIAVYPFGDQEGFGLVITEAMACGCPVIASDLPAMRESIEPGVTGVLVPPRDPARLATAIRDLLMDDERRSSIAGAAIRMVRARFGWPTVAGRYAQVLRQSIGS